MQSTINNYTELHKNNQPLFTLICSKEKKQAIKYIVNVKNINTHYWNVLLNINILRIIILIGGKTSLYIIVKKKSIKIHHSQHCVLYNKI